MKFEYFRFLVSPVKEPQFEFERKKTREQIINDIFETDHPHKFANGRAKYGYVSLLKEGKLIHGRLGKLSSKMLHSSPDQKFQVKKAEDWPGCRVFINLDDERVSGRTFELGQVIAIEVNKAAISNNTNALRAFADHINKTLIHEGYHIAINPILTAKKKFWSVVSEHEGKIKKVVLIYTPPNLFNLKNKLEDDLKEANKTFNTTSTQIVLENDAGKLVLPKDNPLLNQSAQYIDEGSGSYSIHLMSGKKVIKSEEGVKTESFDGLELTIEGQTAEGVTDVMKAVLSGRLTDD